ncbi:hypothetical protein SDC9_141649 [bioreactor metagenome]|uniref:Uncharacterized protein n=1 Tax=bioreactor metagenome TaxID=1076179 RepID=A0A645E0X3_9ZZZZ
MPLIFMTFKSLTRTLWLRFCALYGIEALYENTNALCAKLESRDFGGALRCISDTLQASIAGTRPIYY